MSGGYVNSQLRDANRVADMVTQQIVKVLETKEAELDEEIKTLEQVGDDDLERIREKRLRELKKIAGEKEKWKLLGHGRYDEVDEKEFFTVAKQSPFMVVHFYRSTARRCQILDEHYTRLARKHLETRFIKINAEKSPFLADRLNIHIIPSVSRSVYVVGLFVEISTVIVKNGKTEHLIVGFDEFGGLDDFQTSVVEEVLKRWEVIGVRPSMVSNEVD